MPARHFTAASSEHLDLSLGALNFAYGPGSMACIVRPASLTATQVPFSAGVATTLAGFRMQITVTTGLLNTIVGNAGSALAVAGLAANSWYLIGHCKATGTATPVLHVYDFAANTWTHANGSATQANSTAPATRAQFGCIQTVANFWDGDIEMGAVWNVVLSNSQFEALAYDLRAWWAPANPKGLWILDQDAVAQKVIDQSGNGANQSAITGTTLGTSSVPVLSRGAEMVSA